jgi:hypothetical protein
MAHPPTPEQQAAIDIARTGESCVIEALAGTGKTSTLQMIAEAMPTRNIQYIAFNKAIVTEASTRFPANVTCTTAHALAMRAIGKQYRHRLGGGRMKSDEIARRLRITPFAAKVLGTQKVLAAGFLGGLTMKAIASFCMTGDLAPGPEHLPSVPNLDEPRILPNGEAVNDRRGNNFRLLQEHMRGYIDQAWADICSPGGQLPFTHNHYLKIWQLSNPVIYADVILYDEAQDANGCMLAIVNGQAGRQLVFVGDTYQQIYEWNGAVNALERADPTAPRTHLTESFRFGPGIAMFANKALEWLGAPVELKGRSTAPQFVGGLAEPNVILFRTNGAAVSEALRTLKGGRRPALVGGAEDVVAFAKAAEQLKQGIRVSHPELVCFDNWGEVQDYVEHDPSGSDLKVLVKLVDEHGTDAIIAGLSRCVDERQADVILSTAHKSKGREWDAVQLWGDFPDPEERSISDEDVRLLYVAATRARSSLDPTRVGFFDFQRGGKDE